MKNPKRPVDPAQRAKLIVDMATGEVPLDGPVPKDEAAVKLGKKGAEKRWGKEKGDC